MTMPLVALSQHTVNLIKSSQVISSITSIVKELVENSLDAKATVISVKLENFGFDKLEIKDNGSGIKVEDVYFIAKPHYTSKIEKFEDLDKLSSYGFRGEALSSLCTVSEMSVTTKSEDDSYGFVYLLDSKGDVAGKNPAAITTGTSIIIKNLFKSIPVRRQYYSNNRRKKEELKKIENIIMAFAIIKPKVHITFLHEKSIVFQKPSASDFKTAVHLVFPDLSNHFIFKEKEMENVQMKMWLPKSDAVGCSLSSSDRLFLFVNERPISHKAIEKLVKSYYSKNSENSHGRYPVGVIMVAVPSNAVDINLEPNKTKIYFKDETFILSCLQKLLAELYGAVLPNIKCQDLSALEDSLPCTLAFSQAKDSISDVKLENAPEDFLSYGSSSNKQCKKGEKLCLKPTRTNEISPTLTQLVNMPDNQVKNLTPCQEENPNSNLRSYSNNTMMITTEATEAVITNTAATTTTTTNNNNASEKVSYVQRNELNKLNFSPTVNKPNCSISFLKERTHNTHELKKVMEGNGIPDENSVAISNASLVKNSIDNQRNVDQELPEKQVPWSMGRLMNENDNQRNIEQELPEKQVPWSMGRLMNENDNQRNIEQELPEKQAPCSMGRFINENDNQRNIEPELPEKQAPWSMGRLMNENDNQRNIEQELPEKQAPWSMGSLINENGNIQTVEVLRPPEILKDRNRISTVAKRPLEAPSGLKISPTNIKKFKVTPQRMVLSPLYSDKQVVKPESAFSLFAKSLRKQVIAENPGANFTVIAQELANKWKCADETTKKAFEQKALELRTNGSNSPITDRSFSLPLKEKQGERNLNLKCLSQRTSQNSSKSQSKSGAPSQPKEKPWQNKALPIHLNFESLKRKIQRRKRLGLLTEAIIGNVKGINGWLYRIKNTICAFNASRMNEIILYRSLVGSFAVPSIKLEEPIPLNLSNLGVELWEKLLSLDHKTFNLTNENEVLDKRINSNGFRIVLLKDTNGSEFQFGEIRGVADSVQNIGFEELVEILRRMILSPDLTLAESRPSLLQGWFKEQAMRMGKSAPHIRDSAILVEKLNMWFKLDRRQRNMDSKCLHGRPVFKLITTL